MLETAPGAYSYRLFRGLPQVTYVGLDYSSPLAGLRGDVTLLPFPDEAFDLVLCFHVLEHVPDDRQAMRELRRVLRKTGLLLVQVPIDRDVTLEDPTITDPAERIRFFGQDDHVRAYGRDIAVRLEDAGFLVRAENPTENLSDVTIHRYGLMRDEVFHFCGPTLQV